MGRTKSRILVTLRLRRLRARNALVDVLAALVPDERVPAPVPVRVERTPRPRRY